MASYRFFIFHNGACGVHNAPWIGIDGIGEYIVTFDDRYTAEQCRSFDSSIENTQKQIIVPSDILIENPGANPIALQKLLECFQYSETTPEEFIPPLPENEDATRSSLSASFAQKGVASW